MNPHEKINYIELPARDIPATQAFFTQVFGWKFENFGAEYTAFYAAESGLDGGFYKSDLAATAANGNALVVFYSDELEQTRAKVEAAGGKIIRERFTFPGGRRFHFTEPSGNEFAVWGNPAE